MTGKDTAEVLERIEGHLSDISVALGSIDRNVEVLREIAHITAACILGFNPLGRGVDTSPSEGTAYDADADQVGPEEE